MVGLIDEYAVLCRQWARAQHHAEASLQYWRQRCAQHETEIMRLRGLLLTLRTALLWGMPAPLILAVLGNARNTALPLGEEDIPANQVLCRIGCHGHAHAALTQDGSCRWQGGPCEATQVASAEKQSIA